MPLFIPTHSDFVNKKDPRESRVKGIALGAIGLLRMNALAVFWIARVDRARITVVAGIDEPCTFGGKTRVCCRTRISIIAFIRVVVRREGASTGRFTAHILGACVSVITWNRLCRTKALLANVAGRTLVSVIARSVRSGNERASGFCIASV